VQAADCSLISRPPEHKNNRRPPPATEKRPSSPALRIAKAWGPAVARPDNRYYSKPSRSSATTRPVGASRALEARSLVAPRISRPPSSWPQLHGLDLRICPSELIGPKLAAADASALPLLSRGNGQCRRCPLIALQSHRRTHRAASFQTGSHRQDRTGTLSPPCSAWLATGSKRTAPAFDAETGLAITPWRWSRTLARWRYQASSTGRAGPYQRPQKSPTESKRELEHDHQPLPYPPAQPIFRMELPIASSIEP